jgi:AraC-like DNA-binding protein
MVVRRPRTEALTPFVESLWIYRGELAHDFERVLPNGRVQLLVNLFEDQLRDYALDGPLRHTTSGAALKGPQTQPSVIDTLQQRAVCGVSFVPGGARPFFRAPASELSERMVDLSALWGRDGAVLHERVLEAREPEAQLDALERVLVEQARHGFARDRGFEVARGLLAGGAPVAAVEQRLGLSPRTMIERFRAQTGLTPKRFARVERFQRLVQAMDSVASWTELALTHGYSDQAHMIREFKELSGTTPTAYRPRSPHEKNHSAIALR